MKKLDFWDKIFAAAMAFLTTLMGTGLIVLAILLTVILWPAGIVVVLMVGAFFFALLKSPNMFIAT